MCWDMTKVPAIPQASMTVVLFDNGAAAGTFSSATSQWSDADLCGPYTYTFSLVGASGVFDLPSDVSDFESQLSVSGTSILSSFNDRKFSYVTDNTGAYEVIIETQFGIYGDDSR